MGSQFHSLSVYMSPREKVYDFKKQFKINLFYNSKFYNVTDAGVKRPKNCIFILLKRKDIIDESHPLPDL